MMADFNSELNSITTRLSRMEQRSTLAVNGTVRLGYDEANAITTVDDGLDWSVSGGLWEPYSQVRPIVYDSDTQTITGGGDLTTPYGMPEAHMIGTLCMLTGVVRRRTGAPNLVAGTRYAQPMFGLPDNWRPATNVILSCLMGNTAPDAAGSNAISTAWVEVRPGYDPLLGSGTVSYVTGTSPLSAGTGWIAIQGVFPCQMMDLS